MAIMFIVLVTIKYTCVLFAHLCEEKLLGEEAFMNYVELSPSGRLDLCKHHKARWAAALIGPPATSPVQTHCVTQLPGLV